MRRFALFALMLTVSACGVAPRATAPVPGRPAAFDANYNGAYLSLNFTPPAALERQAQQLRGQLGFLDMSRAIPPRSGEELHVTVGFFPKLNVEKAKAIGVRFRGKRLSLTIDGYGVANQQVAYFTVAGLEEDRKVLQGLKVPYDADDPHVTFGVCPANPRDVHHVSKKAQHAIAPVALEGEYHLMQGKKAIW